VENTTQLTAFSTTVPQLTVCCEKCTITNSMPWQIYHNWQYAVTNKQHQVSSGSKPASYTQTTLRLTRPLHCRCVVQKITHFELHSFDTSVKYSHSLTDILPMKSGHPKLFRTVIHGWTSIHIFTDCSFRSVTSLHINKKTRVKERENNGSLLCLLARSLRSHLSAVLYEENGVSSVMTSFFSSVKCMLGWKF
jgi:hypothetical protein